MKIKTIEEARKLGLGTHSYINGDGKYKDIYGYEHFFRDNKELLPEIKKKHIVVYPRSGDGRYKDTDDYYHLIRDGKELLPNVKKTYAISYPNGNGEYEDVNGKDHIIKGDNNED